MGLGLHERDEVKMESDGAGTQKNSTRILCQHGVSGYVTAVTLIQSDSV